MKVPDWIQALAETCRLSSRAEVAQRVGISTASICLLLKGNYVSDTSRMEAKVRAALMAEQRNCPVLGLITVTRCYAEQAAPYYPSPIRSDLFRACRVCSYRSNAQENQ